MGGEVVLYDGNEQLDPDRLKKKFEDADRISVVLGELKRTDLLGVEMCVISPGISLETPFVAVLDEAGRIDPAKLRPITFDPIHNLYRTLGEAAGRAFHDGLQLK